MADTGIDYLDKSWNPITGCSPVSEGCANCWAKTMAHRLKAMGQKKYQHDDPFAVRFHPDALDEPLRWKKPQRVGVCFMGDWMHDGVDVRDIDLMLEVMLSCKEHTFFTLTKRAYNLERKLYEPTQLARVRELGGGDYLPNLYNGITAENQQRLDERAPHLLKIPGKHWLSLEPLLGAVDIGDYGPMYETGFYDDPPMIRDRYFHWVVVGCESGPQRRPCKLEWIAGIVRQCKAAGVPCYVKQVPLAKTYTGQGVTSTMMLRQLDRYNDEHGWRVSHDPAEWPEAIRVRELP